jgi:hypothetical protein
MLLSFVLMESMALLVAFCKAGTLPKAPGNSGGDAEGALSSLAIAVRRGPSDAARA